MSGDDSRPRLEVCLARSNSAGSVWTATASATLYDEEAYISQLYRRAVLLNGEFQVLPTPRAQSRPR
eukprot:1084001-Rhodomonas_salina.2